MYIYSATGEKLAQKATDGSLTYYRSVMVYEKPSSGAEQLSYMLHPEGIAGKNSNGSYAYRYFKTDHVGSTRVVLTASGNSLLVDQQTDYYPFGLAHDSQIGNLHLNKYLYGGKELQDASLNGSMLGLYDFHARFYNPIYGRWFNFDPAMQGLNPYVYCGNSPQMYVDPDGKIWWLIPAIVGAVFATGNTVAHAIRGDINSVWDAFKYFGQGAVTGFALGCAWQFAPMIPWAGPTIQSTMTTYAIGQGGASVAGIVGGAIDGGWKGIGRSLQMTAGNFYLDENSFFGGIWQGFTRHTWEMPQSLIGHSYSQVNNSFGGVNRVDYLGGATFNTKYGEGNSGMSIGNFINIEHDGEERWSHKTFDDFVMTNPVYMHEYGHTIDSRRWGPFYLPVVGVPSIISASGAEHVAGEPDGVTTHRFRRYEMRANRRAKSYFGKHYGVDWNTLYKSVGTYETFFPTVKR